MASIEMALWSNTPSSYTRRLIIGAEFEMTRSSMWLLKCVGTSTCCWRLRQSSNCRNSAAKWQEGVSIWIFKSPCIIMLVEIMQSVVSRSCSSEMKTEFCLGGQYMRSIVMGKGDLHLNARHSKEENVCRGREDNSKFCLCIIAKPPPRPVLKAFSR